MEWTLDHEDLSENPLMSIDGRKEIRALSNSHEIKIPSVTGDCFMQAPFWKASNDKIKHELLIEFQKIIGACGGLGVCLLVVPLVDNGSINSKMEEDSLVDGLLSLEYYLEKSGVRIAFETDYDPVQANRFIRRFAPELGINYDIGNSAALGFSAIEKK